MTIKAAYQYFFKELSKIYNASETSTITDWIFEAKLSVTKSTLIKNPDTAISTSDSAVLEKALSDLLTHKPIQYVVGEVWFYKMKLKVNEAVLIPRPETEELVALAIDFLSKANEQHVKVLDIGTGSGCISIALKTMLPHLNVTAVDVSAEAIEVAKENAQQYKADIKFLKLDFLDESQWDKLPLFDGILSNPPYIPLMEQSLMDKNVIAYEPATALFVPNDAPLIFYEKIAAFGKTHLQPQGKIWVEVHEDFARETAHVFSSNFPNTAIHKDIYGKNRMVSANY
ncbi:MAG: peptide chain release factor N(5)-glutamine methyltransferase [Ferruginibacter sp.]